MEEEEDPEENKFKRNPRNPGPNQDDLNSDDAGLFSKVIKFLSSAGANPGGNAPVLNLPTSTESLSANNPTAPTASTTPNLNAIKTPDATGQATFSLPGGGMGFVPDLSGSEKSVRESIRPATEEQQAAVIRAIQTAPAGPTISSIRTEDAPAAFMDPNNPGSLLYGNQETADRFNEQARQQMQQSIEASQRASKEVTERMLARAQGEVSAREAESRAREQRAAKRSEMFLPPEERSDAGKKRFTDAQLRRMYPDEADRAKAKVGINPRTDETFESEDAAREQETRLAQQQIAANDAQLEQFRKENRPEYDIALETANNIYNSLLTDFPQRITPQEKNRQIKDLLFDILEQNLGLQNTDLGVSLEEAAIDALALDAQGKGQKTFVYQGKTYNSETKQEITKS
jgi:hypothetical protein